MKLVIWVIILGTVVSVFPFIWAMIGGVTGLFFSEGPLLPKFVYGMCGLFLTMMLGSFVASLCKLVS